jgi:ABC-2 type transport system permease protein
MIGATIQKDVWLLLRDRGRLLMLFAMPMIFIIVFGSMFGGQRGKGTPRTIAIAYAAGDARGEAIEQALAAAPGFAAKPYPTAEAARDAVAHDDASAGLIVPAAGPVELSIDLGAPIQVTGPLQGALTGIVMRAMMPGTLANLPPLVQARTPPGIARPIEDVSGFQVSVPGNAVLFGFFIAMTVAMSFASERTSGAWRRMLAAPVPRWKALFGKLVPYFLIGCIQMALLFGLGATVFGMKVAGSVAALVAISLAVVLCASALGMLVAAFGWTEKQIGSIVPVILLVMGLLGGCMFPRLFMPPFMKHLGLAVPHGWALDGYYDVLIRQGTSLVDIAPQIGALLAFASAFAVLGVWRFRFE